jgi:hypothetical protein
MSIFSRIHQKLGTAGFIISIVALVAALGGGAYAANGALTGKQKKEVEKIAKKVAKPGPEGKQGPAGTAGSTGAKGDAGVKGDAGANGDAGSAGAAGKGVVVASLNPGQGTPPCAEGGVSVEVEGSGAKKSICNGEEGPDGPKGSEGSPWVDGGTLPTGKTETGSWASGQLPKAGAVLVPISFPIPLSEKVAVHFIPQGMENPPTTVCPSGSWEFEKTIKPEAAPGNLCVYETGGFGFTYSQAENAETGAIEEFDGTDEASGKTGAVLGFTGVEFASARGVWAVTAP